MIKPDTHSKLYPLFTMLLGVIFFLSAEVSCYVLSQVYKNVPPMFFLIILLFAVNIIGSIMRVDQKVIAFTFAAVFGLLFSSGIIFIILGHFINSSIMIGVILYFIAFGVIFGSIFGIITYSLKSAWLFSILCGISAAPFGFLYTVMFSSTAIKISNISSFILIGTLAPVWMLLITSMGTGVGLSVGLYELQKAKIEEDIKLQNPVEVVSSIVDESTRFNEVPDDVSVSVDANTDITTEWGPLIKGGANFCTSKLVQIDANTMKSKATAGVIFFFSVFLMVVSGVLAGILVSPRSATPTLLIIILSIIILVGITGLYSVTRPVIFDKNKGVFTKGRETTDNIEIPEHSKKFALLNNIHALQLLASFNPGSNNSRPYYSYELNLVLHDGKRINVIAHGGLKQIRADAKSLSGFLSVPVWDRIQGSNLN